MCVCCWRQDIVVICGVTDVINVVGDVHMVSRRLAVALFMDALAEI